MQTSTTKVILTIVNHGDFYIVTAKRNDEPEIELTIQDSNKLVSVLRECAANER